MFDFPQNPITCNGKLTKDEDFLKATTIKFYYGKVKPAWYQELSDRQMHAADSLQVSVQEDIEQGTVHRCQKILYSIGVKPVKSVSDIRNVLKLCRGSDLVFLWVCLCMYSEENPNKNRKEYCLNERLLLSSICHLDMITTLRELDIMLPQPITSEHDRKSSIKSNKNHRRKIKKSISPYLEACPRPKIPQTLYLPPPPLSDPNFSPYHRYKDPLYVVSNEFNRWFAIPTFIGDFDRSAALKRFLGQMNKEKNDDRLTRILMELKSITNCVCKDNRQHKPHEPLENDVIFPTDLNTIDTEEEFIQLAAKYQQQCMFRIIFRQLIHLRYIADADNIRLCLNYCNRCRSDLKLYEQMAIKNNNLDVGSMCNTQSSSINCINCNMGNMCCGSSAHPKCIDYEKIFSENLIGTCGSVSKRCRKFVQSLDKHAKKLKEFIVICPKSIWKYELRMWSELVFDQKYDDSFYDFPLDKYNGRNTLLMTALLKNALIQLSGNPKYILATLPESYNLPVLQEWIKLRYGSKYSQKERNKEIRVSRVQWDKLLREDVNVRVPTPNDIGNKLIVHYGYRKRVQKCMDALNKAYYNRLSVALVNDCRRFWLTMKPHLCANGPIREMFYAYLPACEYDVLPFRPWKIHEHRPYIKYADPCNNN